MSEPRFKPCMQRQPMLLPPDVSDLIPGNSMVRIVDAIVDGMDRRTLESVYPGGGAPAYDPAMMLKVVLYAYASGVYSSRRIARAASENICFMWLTGMRPLSHSTVNRFRSERIRPVFEEVFSEVVSVLAEAGHITLDTCFLDGTKIEANANRYSFVRKKSTDRYQAALRERAHAHLRAVDELEEEEERLAPAEPEEVDSAAIAEAARRIDERLAAKRERGEGGGEAARALKRASRAIEKDYLPRMERYEGQQATFDGRGSFSKTDPDATFMRMKDDHMGNGQLKVAYNVQAGTENQFVVDTTVHRRPGDTACAIPHLEHVKARLGALPGSIVADAGYGSEENYSYLEAEGVEAFVKHSEFYRERRNRAWREDEMRPANWEYDEEADSYTCPEGRALPFTGTRRKRSELGFESVTRLYTCGDCGGCPRRGDCMRSKDPEARRQVAVNPRLAEYRRRASALLHTERGSALRKRRGVDVETVFGDIKRNLGFTRFTLRGLEKVELERRLVATGHSIRKMFLARTGAEAGA